MYCNSRNYKKSSVERRGGGACPRCNLNCCSSAVPPSTRIPQLSFGLGPFAAAKLATSGLLWGMLESNRIYADRDKQRL